MRINKLMAGLAIAPLMVADKKIQWENCFPIAASNYELDKWQLYGVILNR